MKGEKIFNKMMANLNQEYLIIIEINFKFETQIKFSFCEFLNDSEC